LPTPDVAVAASPSPTPRRMHNLWNWQRPDQCQFLATEVSRDFIPPCPAQISPAQVAALGPAISSRCGTLATNSMTNLEQRTCQITRHQQRRLMRIPSATINRDRLAKCGRSASGLRGNHPHRFIVTASKLRSMLRNTRAASPAPAPRCPKQLFLRQIAQNVSVDRPPGQRINRAASHSPARSAPPQFSAS
jgi:hypothetical protein